MRVGRGDQKELGGDSASAMAMGVDSISSMTKGLKLFRSWLRIHCRQVGRELTGSGFGRVAMGVAPEGRCDSVIRPFSHLSAASSFRHPLPTGLARRSRLWRMDTVEVCLRFALLVFITFVLAPMIPGKATLTNPGEVAPATEPLPGGPTISDGPSRAGLVLKGVEPITVGHFPSMVDPKGCAVVGRVVVVEFAPFEAQCPHAQDLDVSWVDPMRSECAIQNLNVAPPEPLAAVPIPTPAPIITYWRRPRPGATASMVETTRSTPPITPTRLDFGDDEPSDCPVSAGQDVVPRRVHKGPQLLSMPLLCLPSTEDAIAKTSAFLAGITLATISPLLGNFPAVARVPLPTTATPGWRRSGRLAAQPLNLTVRPSKKGEILAMKRLGFLCNGSRNDSDIEAVRKEFDCFFKETMDVKNLSALRDLLPAARVLTDEELMTAVRHASTVVGWGLSPCPPSPTSLA
nr:unnamed protein product [Digitaria exilis]